MKKEKSKRPAEPGQAKAVGAKALTPAAERTASVSQRAAGQSPVGKLETAVSKSALAVASPSTSGKNEGRAAPTRAAAKAAVKPAVKSAPVAKPVAVRAVPPVRHAPAPEELAAKPVEPAKPVERAKPVEPASKPAEPTSAKVTAFAVAFPATPFGMPSGVEQASAVLARAQESSENLRGAVAATTRGLVEINTKMFEHARAQADAAVDLWRSALSAGSVSEAIRVQASGIRQACESTAAHWKDLASTAGHAMGEATTALHSAWAGKGRW
jgi:hypothetical protein